MNISIIYFNDVHGYLEEHPELFYEGTKEIIKTVGGYSRIASFIQSVKNKNSNTLVFDGGDTFHGTLPVVKSKGEVLIPVLKQLTISAMVGHWDFAYGPNHLLHLSSQLNYPVLGINVYKDNGELFLPPYIIKEIGSLKLAVIGICSNIIDKTMPKHFSEGIKITNGDEELPKYINEVQDKGADLVILLSHNGFPQDCDVIAKTNGIDICLSAHTHNRLYEPILINNTIIIQCGCHGSFAGHLELKMNNKKIDKYTYHLVPMDDEIIKDKLVEQQVQKILEPYQNIQKEVVGNTPKAIHRYNVFNSTLDNFLLASIAHAANCSIAFSNGWRYGAPVPKGKITLSNLYNIIPMNPPVSTVELTGEEIKQMLEENIERTFSCNPMKQMGGYVKRCLGITAYIKIENPKGNRIQELHIESKPYSSDRIYKAAFVTEQGVPVHWGKNRATTSVTAIDAMLNYLKTNTLTEELLNNQSFLTV